jgi:hypothetical protein
LTSRLYVARTPTVTVIARRRPWLPGARTVRRRFYPSLIEKAALPTGRDAIGVLAVFLPPLVVFIVAILLTGSLLVGTLTGSAAFFAMAYLAPAKRIRRRHYLICRPDARQLTQSTGREVFGRALDSADRICESWPELGTLVGVANAEAMLTEALWELAGVLVKAEQVHIALVELSRPEFMQQSQGDLTAHEVDDHRRSTQMALVALNAEIGRRVAALERTEAAGRAFIREKAMRRAIHAAEESLRVARDDSAGLPGGPVVPGAPGLSGAFGVFGVAAIPGLSGLGRQDAGAELAEQSHAVLDAYRELNARYRVGG